MNPSNKGGKFVLTKKIATALGAVANGKLKNINLLVKMNY